MTVRTGLTLNASPPRKTLEPDRWFRLFEACDSTTIRIDLAPMRDEDVVCLAAKLQEIAGKSRGRLSLDLSAVEEYSTAWMRVLSDLAHACSSMGGELRFEGMCDRAKRVFQDTRRLHHKPLRMRELTREQRGRAAAA